MTSRFALRTATAAVHRELDDRLSQLNLADRSDYRRFLEIHARTVPSVEGALADAGIGNVLDCWQESRRSGAIESDLSALGEAMPKPAPQPAIGNSAELLGTAYVLEGSRLGGRVLKRQVGEHLPVQFLSRSSELACWTSLIAVMDRLLDTKAALDSAADAACRCFDLFLNVTREAGV